MAGLYEEPRWRASGDTAVIAEFGDSITPEVHRKVRAMTQALDGDRPAGVVEVIPSYCSIMIVFDPLRVDVLGLRETVKRLEECSAVGTIPPPRLVEIPVLYGGEYGPDIEFVARNHGLTVDEVIRIHCGAEYEIYMMGFTPGFAYLGGLPEVLHTPRLETPRPRVPAGSVGIANNQTGIYPVDSPGGWRIIGRTPLRPFDPSRKEPFLYQAGDLIKFTGITNEDYGCLARPEADGGPVS